MPRDRVEREGDSREGKEGASERRPSAVIFEENSITLFTVNVPDQALVLCSHTKRSCAPGGGCLPVREKSGACTLGSWGAGGALVLALLSHGSCRVPRAGL